MSFLFCDCCLNIFSSKKSKKVSNKSYQPSNTEDLDQQQLMTHNINKQARTLPQQYFQQQQQAKDHLKQMNFQLQLNDNIANNQQDRVSQPSSKGDNQQGNQLQEKDHDQNQNLQAQQLPSEQKLKPDYTKFSINFDPYDKYYKLLHEKTQNLEKYFDLGGKPIQFGQTKSNLTIHKIDTSKFQLRYQLPCSYSFYATQMKDSNISNKNYLALFQKCQILQAFKANFTRNLARVKRYSMLEPRQFVYLKYSNGSFKQNWQICISESEEDLLSQQVIEHKRCQIFSVSNFKQINGQLYIRQYIQIDLKASNMNLNMWGKIMHQVKQYFQKLYQHVEKNYQNELL